MIAQVVQARDVRKGDYVSVTSGAGFPLEALLREVKAVGGAERYYNERGEIGLWFEEQDEQEYYSWESPDERLMPEVLVVVWR